MLVAVSPNSEIPSGNQPVLSYFWVPKPGTKPKLDQFQISNLLVIIVFKVPLDKFAFQLLNGVGDYPTLRDALNPQGRPDWSKMTKNEIVARVGNTIFLDQ